MFPTLSKLSTYFQKDNGNNWPLSNQVYLRKNWGKSKSLYFWKKILKIISERDIHFYKLQHNDNFQTHSTTKK